MLYQQIARNKRRTVYVMVAFFALVALVGAALGYWFAGSAVGGVIIAGVLTLIYMSVMVAQSTEVVMNMNHAREIHSATEAPQLWHVVEDMAMVAQVPMPRVFIIDDPSPNAFATGNDPEHAAVAATSGLLSMMNREELEGVMGHEMSHVRNYDIRLQTIALALSAVITALTSFAGNWWWLGGRNNDEDNNSGSGGVVIALIGSILMIILAPLAATLAQMALSRNREYLADAGSVELTRNPQGLISALRKLENVQPMTQANVNSSALYITDPFKNAKHHAAHLFDTHPPLEDRIKRLEEM